MEPSSMNSGVPLIAQGGNAPRNLYEEPIDSEHVLASPRVPYIDVQHIVESAGKAKWMAQIVLKSPLSCCREPRNYDIEAWYSKGTEPTPDIYKFVCRVCEARVAAGTPDERGVIHDGCTKVAFCVGGGDYRPMWDKAR